MDKIVLSEKSDLFDQRQNRIKKLAILKSKGIEAFPSRSNKQNSNIFFVNNFSKYSDKKITVAGRITSIREHGDLKFFDIEDESGKIQLYLKKEIFNLSNKNLDWENLDLLDTADFIEASGILTKTKRGEISVQTENIKLLTKALRPLPAKNQDFSNKEERFRRRYLDMTVNPEVRDRFKRRSLFWQGTREFLLQNDFFEINIPVLEHITGGADAKPFVTYYDSLDQNFYLRISHELPLKKLLGGGFEKVFDIGPRFRNEGFSDEHLPEHIAMEFYWAYADNKQGMEFTKDMFRFVMNKVYGKLKFNIRGFEVDLEKEWEIIKFPQIMNEHYKIDVLEAEVSLLNKILNKNNVFLKGEVNRSRVIDNLWKIIRKTIAGPAFLIDVPKFLSPLAKSNPEDPKVVDRFQPIIAGSELANAWSELNDPVDQLDRFVQQQKLRESGDEEAHMLDIDYIEMLEYGMPPAVGYGMSERVFWFFEGVSAKEGVPFPQLKYEIDKTTKTIYKDIKKYILPEKDKDN